MMRQQRTDCENRLRAAPRQNPLGHDRAAAHRLSPPLARPQNLPGDDTPGDASRLHFPSYGADAARLLVEEREVGAVGADVASINYGQARDFMVHRIAAVRNVPGLENLTDLGDLPARGAVVIALPMKIEGGSGGPVRVIALVPRE